MFRRNFLKSVGAGFITGLFGGFFAKETVAAPVKLVPAGSAESADLKAFWSEEAAADFAAWKRTFEQDLTDLLAEEINAEIDREILADLMEPNELCVLVDYGSLAPDSDYGSVSEPVYKNDKYGRLYRRSIEAEGVDERFVRKARVLSDGSLEVESYVIEQLDESGVDFKFVRDANYETVMKKTRVPAHKWKVFCYDESGNVIHCLTTTEIVWNYVADRHTCLDPNAVTITCLDPDTAMIRKGVLTRYSKKL